MYSTIISPSSNHGLSRYADCLATFFSYSELQESYWIGGWIKITAHELHEYSNKKNYSYSEVTNQEIRNDFIALLINKICHNSYGAGQVYELYEVRKQKTLCNLFKCLRFSKEEEALIASQCDYLENMEAFKDPCDACGIDVGALQMAMSLNIAGKTLCTNCLSY